MMSIGINIKQWKKYCTKYLNNTMHKKKKNKIMEEYRRKERRTVKTEKYNETIIYWINIMKQIKEKREKE